MAGGINANTGIRSVVAWLTPPRALANMVGGHHHLDDKGHQMLTKPFAVFCTLVLTLASACASAATITFDFEGLPATGTSAGHPGALVLLPMTSSGLTATFLRESGDSFDVADMTTFVVPPGTIPAAFGTRSLSPFANETSATAFIVNFSSSVSSAAISFGDFGADLDDFSMQAFSGLNGTGTTLATTANIYGSLAFPNIDTGTVSAPGINSIVFIGGTSDFPNSLYFDNLTVTSNVAAIPEPSTYALMLAGLGFVGFVANRRRKPQVSA
jgi:hypothetical protein